MTALPACDRRNRKGLGHRAKVIPSLASQEVFVCLTTFLVLLRKDCKREHLRGFFPGPSSCGSPSHSINRGVRSPMGARFDGNEHSIGRKGMPAFSQAVFRVPKECPQDLVTCMPGGAFFKKKISISSGAEAGGPRGRGRGAGRLHSGPARRKGGSPRGTAPPPRVSARSAVREKEPHIFLLSEKNAKTFPASPYSVP